VKRPGVEKDVELVRRLVRREPTRRSHFWACNCGISRMMMATALKSVIEIN